MYQIPKASSFKVVFAAFLSSDHLTLATGKTIAVTLSKDAAAFGNPSAGATNATEIGSGLYYVTLSTTDTGTSNALILKGTEGSIDTVVLLMQVVDGAAILDVAAGVETGLTVRQALRLISSFAVGVSTGMNTPTNVFRDFGNTKPRITATVSATGRSAVTTDAT